MYKREKQVNWNAEETQFERITKLGDNLELLDKMIDWEMFRAPLEKKLRKEDYSKGGRPPIDVIVLFKIFILQQLNGNLSNDKTEFWMTVRLDWMRFLGYYLGERTPDANTIWTFKEKLGSETMEELFELFNKTLYEKGTISCKGTLIDASFNDVPRRRATTREENKQLKEGEIPDSLKKIENPQTPEDKAHNNKISQIDTDASWAKKGEETHFGYKGHVAVDEESKIVTNVVVTTAKVHDVRVFVHLICLYWQLYKLAPLAVMIIYADSGYTGEDYANMLKGMFGKGIFHVIRRAKKGRCLGGWEKSYNRSVSKIRCRVEHVFGAISNDMGGITTNAIGIARNTRDIFAKFLAYNIKRAAFLFSKAAA